LGVYGHTVTRKLSGVAYAFFVRRFKAIQFKHTIHELDESLLRKVQKRKSLSHQVIDRERACLSDRCVTFSNAGGRSCWPERVRTSHDMSILQTAA
jgi:hypothetical protein